MLKTSVFSEPATSGSGSTLEQTTSQSPQRTPDFRERSVLEGFPPKVIWLEVGNAGTAAIAAMLIEERPRVLGFDQDENSSMLILTLGVNAV